MTPLSEVDEIERITARVFSLFSEETAEFIACERFEPFNPTLPWIHLALRYGGVIGVSWGESISKAESLARAVSLGRRLRRSGLAKSYLLVEGFQGVAPRLQRVIEPVSRGLARPLRFAVAEEIRYVTDGYGPITDRLLAKSLVVSVELYGVTEEVKRGGRIFFDALHLTSSGRRFRSRAWRVDGEGIQMTVEERLEIGGEGPEALLASEVHVVVDIGAFEMRLGELLGLRPGARVELPYTAPLRGILKIEGAALGLVTLQWSEGSLVATIEELSLFARTEKNVEERSNEEEKSPIRRCGLPPRAGMVSEAGHTMEEA